MKQIDTTAFEEACRRHGLKMTAQRIEVFRAVMTAPDHPSVEQIHSVVRRRLPSISLDTVYRTVDTFEEIGLVTRLTGADGRFRFDSNLEQHQHLVCVRCQRIEDIHWSGLETLAPPRPTGWSRVAVGHVELRGLCSSCRDKA